MKRTIFLLVASLFLFGICLITVCYRTHGSGFAIDPAQPFRIEFGRGSGMLGLNTIKIDQDGNVVIHRMLTSVKNQVESVLWETGSLKLNPAALSELLASVQGNALTALRKEYHADIHDGTQWVLWIKQVDREKSVYFNNHFPRRIQQFSRELDQILLRAGSDEIVWREVPEKDSRNHSRELWASIRR